MMPNLLGHEKNGETQKNYDLDKNRGIIYNILNISIGKEVFI